MASDENDPRRNRSRDRDQFDEHNPFIAFRRFADSHVSSLLNTVFTLPATIANYKNVHVAREHCLFGRADSAKCEQLHELEEETARVIAECRELYRAGNVEQALDRGEALLQLNHAADELRKQIVEGGQGSSPAERRAGLIPEARDGNSRTELVERVANEKGQQWGWSWDWGFPKPFDADEDIADRRDRCRRWRRRREESMLTNTQAAEQRDAAEDRSMFPDQQSWVEQQRFLHQLDEALLPIFQELFRRESSETADVYDMAGNSNVAAELVRVGVPRDAFEDLLRSQNGYPLMPQEKLGQSDHLLHENWCRRFFDRTDRGFVGRPSRPEYPKRVPWEGEETAEEPNYEYAHDHEDQHDEPPSPKTKQGGWSSGMPETEMEAYERLLGPTPAFGSDAQTEGRPSVLSTLTTTERTVHPDGTVTTKVVLKKRFNDGREESSETVHTERGQDSAGEPSDSPSSVWEAAAQHKPQEQARKDNDKKTGWFWSS
ncbi:hypothetical protein DPSP01_004173 [Paraphaeosphaeria sporulosa]|uniref:Uncharacterized protein n=1 Tax=Paraphaeosphaeria sporulosa TaxID=1460663 RepID=A0A177CD31_9PLEO|nr:uncharacterized protein CC84DRAFT_1218056 [Paraphaeosphaeria sporulosa]OAG04620.1 hypothetical protein CC84DRAFT_1218056 [Paraphaeosphaeria sporulosa]